MRLVIFFLYTWIIDQERDLFISDKAVLLKVVTSRRCNFFIFNI